MTSTNVPQEGKAGKDRYSVSIVYQKPVEYNRIESALRVFITDAVSEDEALGIGINHFSDEMENYSILLKAVIKIQFPTKIEE
jgi:hypothetical protein